MNTRGIKLSIGVLLWGLCTWGQQFQRIEEIVGLHEMQQTTGVAVADIDRDNDLDLFVVAKADFDPDNPATWSRLFRNENNGRFEDITVEAGLLGTYNYDETDPGWDYGVKMGAAWGDFDNDGYPDLLLTGWGRKKLYHNQQDGTFVDISKAAGLGGNDSCYYTSALWWDVDQDGWLDLYLSKWGGCSQNRLFHNQGDGSFLEITQQTQVGGKQAETWMSLPIDANQDGRWDLYLANDFSENELFIQQEDGSFIDQAALFGLNQDGNDMGMSIADYNLDGRYDIFITNIAENRLLTANSDQTYTDHAAQKGVFNAYWAWGTRFGDVDLDGDEDLFVANGYQNDALFFTVLKTNFLYQNQHQQGEPGFTDVSNQSGVKVYSNSMGMEVFDYDLDGDLDWLVSNMNSGLFFYENRLMESTTAPPPHWIQISLEGTQSNRDGLGTALTVFTPEGAFSRYYVGAAFLGQSLRPLHIGIGQASHIDSLVIRWPSGQVDIYKDMPIDRHLKVREADSYADITKPAIKVKGCTDLRSCTYNPNAVIDDGTCTYLNTYPITGDTQAGYVSEHMYSYPVREGSSYHWQVSGGEILSGQGSATIIVKWGVADSGFVSVKEINTCEAAAPAQLSVDLNIEQVTPAIGLARLWNEVLLEAIRGDFARPTVHARNLFHTSIAMYDAWAIYDHQAETYLLGKQVGTYLDDYCGFVSTIPREKARLQTLSYAAYRLLEHRFQASPGAAHTFQLMDLLMQDLGLDPAFRGRDYSTGNPAALGNYLAASIIAYGMQDGAGEAQSYENISYQPVNQPLAVSALGNPSLQDPNRWQPLALKTFIDQGGNLISGNIPDFLSPEWGQVTPFALQPSQRKTYTRDQFDYQVYHDPGLPPLLDPLASHADNEPYQWGFSLVSIWGAHLDPADSVMWEISPASIGNLGQLPDLPTAFKDYPTFYQQVAGGDISRGWDSNPVTGTSYSPQWVPRGDYTRVLAEFWADGPDSETPPGHWYVLLNGVSDHPLFAKKLNGQGPVLDPLEWEVKSYFILGGAMHDAAIAAWGIKGWYDYIRPISAIRYMADRGQSSAPSLPHYDPGGIPLLPGYIELIREDDPLAGQKAQHVGKIKLYTWKGHRFIQDPDMDQAGVGWIRAEDWMPYQRPSFVTPPFAGYVSGHSTYSRAAAEVMTLLTGSAFFPGGMGEFIAAKNDFLVFEEGPSQDVHLQWATYRDASDQCSLSRIWGGIHPPADDLPGRMIGATIGQEAFAYALPYFAGQATPPSFESLQVFPNPVSTSQELTITPTSPDQAFTFLDVQGRMMKTEDFIYHSATRCTTLTLDGIKPGIYLLKTHNQAWKISVY